MKIFVIGSYSVKSKKEINDNIQKAIRAGIKILKKGHLPFVPQSMFAFWEESIEMENIMKACFEWIKECDAVLVLNTGKKEGGIYSSIEVARKNNKIIFNSLDELPQG